MIKECIYSQDTSDNNNLDDNNYYFFIISYTISAVANLSPTCVIFTFKFCPACPFFTKITNPCILAIPSPLLLVSVICTSYSLPVSPGFEPKLLLKLLPLLLLYPLLLD